MALEKELATYKAKLEELKTQPGKYVLIHGDDVMGTFGTYDMLSKRATKNSASIHFS